MTPTCCLRIPNVHNDKHQDFYLIPVSANAFVSIVQPGSWADYVKPYPLETGIYGGMDLDMIRGRKGARFLVRFKYKPVIPIEARELADAIRERLKKEQESE